MADYTYTGQRSETDAFGLMYYRARWGVYPERRTKFASRRDPSLGHFVSANTIVPGAGNSLAWDRYAYVYNNPLRYTDPSGHWVETAWDIANIGWDLYEVYRNPRKTWNALTRTHSATWQRSLIPPSYPVP